MKETSHVKKNNQKVKFAAILKIHLSH